MRDRNGVSYARKAMIWCGLSLDINGQWHSGQRSTELQEIIKWNRKYYDGKDVPPFGASFAEAESSLSEAPLIVDFAEGVKMSSACHH